MDSLLLRNNTPNIRTGVVKKPAGLVSKHRRWLGAPFFVDYEGNTPASEANLPTQTLTLRPAGEYLSDFTWSADDDAVRSSAVWVARFGQGYGW
jgi:hypothetical protein